MSRQILEADKNVKQMFSELEGLRLRLTELKKDNAKLVSENQALKRAEKQLRIIVENAYDIVFQLSPSGMIQYVSPKVKEIYGYEPAELVGKHLKETTPLIDLPKALKALKTAFSGRDIINFELNQLDVNGNIIAMEINATPIKEGDKIIAVEGIMRNITERKRMEEEAKHSTEKLVKAMENTISAMAMIIEMRDPYTAGHQKRVTQLACAMAKEIGLAEDEITGLRLAGLIHDIGKVRVPAEILTNPDGLSDAEFTMIKMHPVIGHEILKTIDLPWPIADIIHQHHERMDGSGYPSSLAGTDIIIEARVLAVADVVEAISSHRPYRPAHGVDIALDEIENNSGILYDASAVGACLRLFKEQGFRFEQDPVTVTHR